MKNRYVGRTFIMPGQGVRRKSVRQKLNVIASEFKGRNVLLVDDSIVRGTTSREIVQMARDAGARARSTWPRRAAGALPERLRHRHADQDELVAHNRSIEDHPPYIGADALIYQDVAAMKKVVGTINPKLDGFGPRASTASTSPATCRRPDTIAAQRKKPGRRGRRTKRSPGPAERRGVALMSDNKRIPRVEAARRPAPRHAGRARGLPASAWGENSEALFLTSSFRQPGAATAAARFANEEEASSTRASPTRR